MTLLWFLAAGRVVQKKPDGCWLWGGEKERGDYGRVRLANRKPKRAHRVSFEMHVRPLNEGECVCHRCDNPPCVNPAHLFAGSQRDNVRDMVAKGRARGGAIVKLLGSQKTNSKLDEAKAKSIYADLARGVRVDALAREFGVTRAVVQAIGSGRSWVHCTPGTPLHLDHRRGSRRSEHPNNHFVTVGDRTLHIEEWSRVTGLKASTIRQRIARGWSADRAVSEATTPCPRFDDEAAQ